MTCPLCQFYQEDAETLVGEEYGDEVDGWGCTLEGTIGTLAPFSLFLCCHGLSRPFTLHAPNHDISPITDPNSQTQVTLDQNP